MTTRWWQRATMLLLVGITVLAFVPPVLAQSPVNVSASQANSRSAAVAITAQGTIHVVWEESTGLYHRWRQGDTWSAIQQISIGGEHPVLLVDRTQPEVVYLAWDEPFGNTRQVFVRRWRNGSWELPRNVSQTDGYSAQPSLAQYPDGTLVLVWSDTTPGTPTLYRTTSTDGQTWPTATPLQGLAGTNPRVVIAGSTEFLFWLYRPSFREARRLLWSRYTNNQWSLPEVLSNPTRAVEAFDARAGAGDTIWVAWNELGDVVVRRWMTNAWADRETLALEAQGRVSVVLPAESAPAVLWTTNSTIYRSLWQKTWAAPQSWWKATTTTADVATATDGQRVVVAWSQEGQTAWDVWLGEWGSHRTWIPWVRR